MSPRSSAECTSSSSSSGRERTGLDVGAQPLQRVEHRGQGGVVEQAGGVQHPGVRARSGEVVQGEPPVEVGRLRQGGERVGRAAGEPPAPQGGLLATRVGSVTGGPFGCRTAGGRRPRRCVAAPAVTTMMVSSPAMVPSTPSRPAWSRADARKFAAPGGVRRTTRLAECSAETSSSWQRGCSRVDPLLAVRRGAHRAVAALARHGVHEVLADAAPARRRRRRGRATSVAWVTSMPSVGEVVEQLGLRAHRGRREDLDDPLLAGGARGGDGHRASPASCCSTSQDSSAFCACSRFSASCQTSDAGPSMHLGVDLVARGRPAGSAGTRHPRRPAPSAPR